MTQRLRKVRWLSVNGVNSGEVTRASCGKRARAANRAPCLPPHAQWLHSRPMSAVRTLVTAAIGPERADFILSVIDLDHAPAEADPGRVSRATVTTALTTVLFADLLQRVPTAAAYVA